MLEELRRVLRESVAHDMRTILVDDDMTGSFDEVNYRAISAENRKQTVGLKLFCLRQSRAST